MNRKYKIDKETSKRLLASVMAGFMFVTGLGLSGCSKKDNNETDQFETEVVSVDPDEVINNTLDDLTNKLSGNIENKFFLNSDDQKSSIVLLNLDYIISNATYDENGNLLTTALDKIYPNGLNTKKELNDLNTFLSKYREYTRLLKSTDDFICLSDYALIEKDKIIIAELENMTKELITLINKGNKEDINNLFNKVSAFFVDEGALIINGKEYKKEDLSNGFRKGSEVFGTIFSEMTPDYVSETDRKNLDNKLKTTDSIYQIEVLLEVFANSKQNVINTMINNQNTYILDDSDIEVINSFNSKYDQVYKDTKEKINLTTDEISSMVQIANIDYLASDNVSAGAMKSIITKDFDTVIKHATSGIKKVESYNKSHINDLYTYEDLFMNDEENLVNIVAIKGNIYATLNLLNEVNSNSTYSEIYNNQYFQFLELYNNYSSEATINGADGSKITKNDTGYGTRFITNNIARIALESLPVKFDSTIETVDDDEDLLSVIPRLQSLMEDKCSKYQYVK